MYEAGQGRGTRPTLPKSSLMGGTLLRLVLTRTLFGLGTLLVVSAVIFFTVGLLPGDFATEILGQAATPETVAALRQALQLDEPILVRYLGWLGGILRGDLGTSYASGEGAVRTVASLIGYRLANTLVLAGATALVAVPLAVGLGLLAALWRNSWFDRLANSATLATISCPEFLAAYLLMLFLSVKYNWFYSLSSINAGMGFVEILQRIALPVLTLTLVITAHMMRMTRAAIIGVLSHPYIEMARCKGLSPRRIILRHALPNAIAPIANVVAFSLSFLVVGVVVVETVFVYPGIGHTMVDAVRTRDIPVVQACALIFAGTYILLNLLADIVSIAANPRLLHPQ
jgi:peptide/nickel transport system permease protein